MSLARKKILAFGTFDLLHAGHRSFLKQAADLGDYLTVVVARDAATWKAKGRPPVKNAIERLSDILTVQGVDEAHLADKRPESYKILRQFTFNVLAVGYDQAPADDEITRLLRQLDKAHVRVVRLQAFAPGSYKTSRIRDTLGA